MKDKQEIEDEVDELNMLIQDLHHDHEVKDFKKACQERDSKITEMAGIEFEIYSIIGQMTDLFNYGRQSFQMCFAEYEYAVMENKEDFDILVQNQTTGEERICKTPDELRKAFDERFQVVNSKYKNLGRSGETLDLSLMKQRKS